MVQSAPGSLAAGNDAPGPGQYDVSLAMEVQWSRCFLPLKKKNIWWEFGLFRVHIFNNTSLAGKKVKRTWPNGINLAKTCNLCTNMSCLHRCVHSDLKNMLAPLVGSSLHCNDQNWNNLCVSRVIPNPSTININTKTSPFSVFIGMISSNTCMIQRKRLQAISFSTAKALKSQRFKESSFPKAIMETVGSRNRCLLWDILCQKLQKKQCVFK